MERGIPHLDTQDSGCPILSQSISQLIPSQVLGWWGTTLPYQYLEPGYKHILYNLYTIIHCVHIIYSHFQPGYYLHKSTPNLVLALIFRPHPNYHPPLYFTFLLLLPYSLFPFIFHFQCQIHIFSTFNIKYHSPPFFFLLLLQYIISLHISNSIPAQGSPF